MMRQRAGPRRPLLSGYTHRQKRHFVLLCCVILLLCIQCLFAAVLNPVVVISSRLVDVLSPLVSGLHPKLRWFSGSVCEWVLCLVTRVLVSMVQLKSSHMKEKQHTSSSSSSSLFFGSGVFCPWQQSHVVSCSLLRPLSQ